MNAPTIDEIRAIVDSDPRYYYRTIRRLYPTLYADLNDGDRPFVENLYCWLYNQGQPILCPCGARPGFQSMRLGYFRYCSAKCAADSKSVKDRRRVTCMDRFGVPNSHQSEHVRAKFHATMIERYGVANALESPAFLAKAHAAFQAHDQAGLQAKRQQTNVQRYGVPHPTQNPAIRARVVSTNLSRYGVDTPLRLPSVIEATKLSRRRAFMDDIAERVTVADPTFVEFLGVNAGGERILHKWQCRQCAQVFDGHLDDGGQPRCPGCFPLKLSRGHIELRDYMASLGVHMMSNDRSLIAPMELDLVDESRHLAIEYNGLYYHHDGKVAKHYHLDKLTRCQELGYRLIHIFENEWQFQADIVKSRLASIVGCNERLYARRTQVTQLAARAARQFLNQTHLQGACPSSLQLALVQDDTVVAVMTFGKPRFSKKYDMELLRYACRLNTTVVGGASKLLAHFRTLYPKTSVVSYADRRWSNGDLYRVLGFCYSHSSTPNYHYTIDKLHLESRLKFQKHKLPKMLTKFDPHLSEAANMYANGYLRIWDCGNDVYVLQPTTSDASVSTR